MNGRDVFGIDEFACSVDKGGVEAFSSGENSTHLRRYLQWTGENTRGYMYRMPDGGGVHVCLGWGRKAQQENLFRSKIDMWLVLWPRWLEQSIRCPQQHFSCGV